MRRNTAALHATVAKLGIRPSQNKVFLSRRKRAPISFLKGNSQQVAGLKLFTPAVRARTDDHCLMPHDISYLGTERKPSFHQSQTKQISKRVRQGRSIKKGGKGKVTGRWPQKARAALRGRA